MRLLFTPLLAAASFAQEICPPTPVYSPCDIRFTLPAGDALAPPLRAEVKSPKFKTSLVPVFWNGGDSWTLRVTPMEPGTYEFRLSGATAFQGKTGSFQATANDHPGFIRPANVHHWIHPDSLKPHLWQGGGNHEVVRLDLKRAKGGDPTYFAEFEKSIRERNQRGVTADIVIAPNPADWLAQLPDRARREAFVQALCARIAPLDVTWLLFGDWENGADGRPLARELGQWIKQYDPYNHPRSTLAKHTSSPLIADGWMDYVAIGSADETLAAVEHQFFHRPFVSFANAPNDARAARVKLWNMTMSGAYPAMSGLPGPLIDTWKSILGKTRFWELEPYFDVDGGRALALDDVEYLVYIEKPSGPIEVLTAKHGYDVYWINPETGESTKAKDYKGERFVGEAPSPDRDWLLHLSRDGRKEGMAKSYKFESRQNLVQEPEQSPERVPFEIALPDGDEISLSKPPEFAIKVKRETRATRQLSIVWTGEVVADGQGARVLSLGSKGRWELSPHLAVRFPAVFNVRVSAINANGKAYALDRVYRLIP
jgi:hypothetical protein